MASNGTHHVEHRSNGKTIRKPISSARDAAENLFKKAEAPPEGSAREPQVATIDHASKLTSPDASKVSISIRDAATFQACFRLGMKLWESIGRPKKIDITGNPLAGFNIISGNMISIQRGRTPNEAVTFEVAARKLKLPPYKRFAAKLDAKTQNGLIFVSPPSKEWLRGTELTDADLIGDGEVAEPKIEVLPDLTPQVPDEPPEEIGSISVRSNTAGALIAFAIPLVILSRLNDPKRVLVSGKCSEGYTLKPVHEGGLAVNYAGGANSNAYVTISTKHSGLTDKRGRKPFSVKMAIKDGAIKVSGPGYEWIRGADMWLRDPPAPTPLAHSPEYAISPQSNGNGGITAPLPKPSVNYRIPDNAGVAELQRHVGELLAQFADAKRMLEEKTGMKFLLTRELRLVADLGVPAGFVPPAQQREIR